MPDEQYYEQNRPELIHIIKPKSGEKILDIGCAKGNFGAQMKTIIDCEVWGVEINSEIAAHAKLKLDKVVVGSIEETHNELPDNYFDKIIFNDSLEHMLAPWDVLRNLSSKLNNNGKIHASIPNVRHCVNLFKLLVLKDWKYTNHGILDITHLRFFTKKSIRRMFEYEGMRVIKLRGVKITGGQYWPLALILDVLTLFIFHDTFYLNFYIEADIPDK